MSLAVILQMPDHAIRINHKLESSVIKMIRRVRPDWPKTDIILHMQNVPATEEGEVVLYSGYAEDKLEPVMVKIYASGNALKVRYNGGKQEKCLRTENCLNWKLLELESIRTGKHYN